MGCDYTLDQLMENPRYKEICDLFINSAKTLEERETFEKILLEGQFEDFYFVSHTCNKDNPFIEGKRRLAMASLYKTNPDTFLELVRNRINLFHGTNANALPSILKYGLNSSQKSVDDGIEVVTGEKSTRMYQERRFVSFTDIFEIAKGYATLSPEKRKEELNFEVVVCTTTEDAHKIGVRTISSDVVEMGIMNNVPVSSIKALIVPEDRVEFVKKLLPNDEIKVLGLNTFANQIYYADEYGITNIDYEFFKQPVEEPKPRQVHKEEVKRLVSTRLLSRIREKLHSFIFNEEVAYAGKGK